MNQLIRALILLFVGLLSTQAQSPTEAAPDLSKLRIESDKHQKEGNWKDALVGFSSLITNPQNGGAELAKDLQKALQSQTQLNEIHNFDSLIESALAVHPKDWQLLSAAGWAYQNCQHGGTIVDNIFQRGKYDGGKQVSTENRDRVRGLQLLERAAVILSEKADATNDQKALFFSRFAQLMGQRAAWELQALTDLTTMPDYEEGFRRGWHGRGYHAPGGNDRGAPVDEKGNPVAHAVPADWKSAVSDGERWRWLLAQWANTSPSAALTAEMQFAQFLQRNFDVHTMAQWMRRASDETVEEKQDALLAIHTLKEDETTARLAIGIKRFTLPEELNFIARFKRLAEQREDHTIAFQAASQLASTFQNRRQFPRAVEVFRETLTLKISDDYKKSVQSQIDQIVKNWGRFDASLVQPAGKGASVGFVFRNATKARFTAKSIDVKALLSDVKKYLASNPENLNYQRIQIEQLGYQILEKEQAKYVGKEVAAWDVALQPREHHWDRRIDVSTPLQTAGAYLVESQVIDGNKSAIIVWISDTAIVKKNGVNEAQYYVVDSLTGKPISKANLEFFGYRAEALPERKQNSRRYQNILTRNFAEFTDEQGQFFATEKTLPSNHNWLITATTEDGRFAHLGFTNTWYQSHNPDHFDQQKIHIITDRPVYRPGQPVKIKAWARRANYDAPTDKSVFAKLPFTMTIYDGRGTKVLEKTLTTDEFGGMADELELKADATLGVYQVSFSHKNQPFEQQGNFRVEEYKKPEFEVVVDAPTEPIQLGEKVSAKLSAKYYFGAPVVNAKVKYKIQRSAHDSRWFPARDWDWFYGPGYWWFSYDYDWYPGWKQWGCVGPIWWWNHFQADPPELVVENEVEIGADGSVQVEFDTALAKALHADEDHRYEISVEVTDESRRTITGSGEVLVARQPFKVNVWTDRGHYEVGQPMEFGIKAQTLNQKGVAGEAAWSLLKISYNDQGAPVEKEVQKDTVKTDEAGSAKLKLNAAEAGQYRLRVKLTDAKGHAQEGAAVFVVRGAANNKAGEFRFNALELVADKAEYAPGEEVKLLINTDQRDSTVFLFLRSNHGIVARPQLLKLEGKSMTQAIKVATGDMPNFFIEAFTVSEGKIHTAVREIAVPPAKRILNLEVITDATKHKPQDKAKVKIKLTDLEGKPFEGSTVVTVYDKALEAISGGSNVPNIKEFFWKWRRHFSASQEHNLGFQFPNLSFPRNSMGMQALGIFGNIASTGVNDQFKDDRRREGRSAGFGAGGGLEMLADAAPAPMASMSAPMEEGAKAFAKNKSGVDFASAPAKDSGGAPDEPTAVTVRSSFADAVFWAASLNTNKEGIAEIEVPLPDNLTTWIIKSWGMGHGTRVGQGQAEIITSKDLILRQQAPRFFVEKDEVVLSANVHNYLPVSKTVKVTLEFEGRNLEPLANQAMEQTITLDSMKEKRVDWRVKAVREGTAVVRMKAVTEGESDAMQMSYPVFVHGMLKTDSFSGAIRPEVASGKIEITIPQERRPEQSRVEIRYSPTIATTILDAIPYLAQYPHGCTEQTLNRFLPAVLAHKTLRDMGIDLKALEKKITNLNPQEIGETKERVQQWKHLMPRHEHPVFNEKQYTLIVKQGLEKLTSMQNGDGGWGWFHGDREESYPHTTAVVVHGLTAAKAAELAMVPDLLNNGVRWLERHEARQVAMLKAWPKGKDSKPKADAMDAFVHMVLAENGKFNKAMRDLLYRDRVDLPVYAKACLGLALDMQGEVEKRDMLIKNVEQYLVMDGENQTARLDLKNGGFWWYWYGSEYEAEAFYLKLLCRVDPKSDKASGLVKYLINNRKNSTYWHSTRDTAYVVEALNDYLKATKEAEPDVTVQVLVDGAVKKEVKITKENLFTFDGTLVLTGADVTAGKHTVEIRKQGNSPIYFNAYVTNFTLEDRITKAGLEVKVERRYYKLKERKDANALVSGARGQAIKQRVLKYDREPLVEGQPLKSGDLVEVDLVIESKNDYEYLLFEDMKPAGLEAVDLRSGFVYEGLSAYREFRDERVCFYLRQVPLGKHSLTYKLKAEIPGIFSALPAKASAMYAPELRGNSDETKVTVTD